MRAKGRGAGIPGAPCVESEILHDLMGLSRFSGVVPRSMLPPSLADGSRGRRGLRGAPSLSVRVLCLYGVPTPDPTNSTQLRLYVFAFGNTRKSRCSPPGFVSGNVWLA